MSNIQPVYPVVLYSLEEGDKGYAQGARYRIDAADRSQFAFRTREAADEFMAVHGLTMINESDMIELRKVMGEGQ